MMDKLAKNKKILIVVGLVIALVIGIGVYSATRKTPYEYYLDSLTEGMELSETADSEETDETDEDVSEDDFDNEDYEETTEKFVPTTSMGEKLIADKYDVEFFVADRKLYCKNLADNSKEILLAELDKDGEEMECIGSAYDSGLVYYSVGNELIMYNLVSGEKSTLYKAESSISSSNVIVRDNGEKVFVIYDDGSLHLLNNGDDKVIADGGFISDIVVSPDGEKIVYINITDEENFELFVKNGDSEAIKVYESEYIGLLWQSEDFSENITFKAGDVLAVTDFSGKVDIISQNTILSKEREGSSIGMCDDGTIYYLGNNEVAQGTDDFETLNVYYYNGTDSILIDKNVSDCFAFQDCGYGYYTKWTGEKNEFYYTDGKDKAILNVPEELSYYDIICEIEDELYYRYNDKFFKIKAANNSKPVELKNILRESDYYSVYDSEFVYIGKDNVLYVGNTAVAQSVEECSINKDVIYYTTTKGALGRYRDGKADIIASKGNTIYSFV